MASVGAYCADHARPRHVSGADYDRTRRKDDPALALAATIRGSARWQRLRDYHRSLAPICCDPFDEHRSVCTLATTSHHVEPIGQRPDLAFRLENLAPLCTRCHARVERMERSGQPTRHLFAEKGISTPRHLCDAHEGIEGGEKSLPTTRPPPSVSHKYFLPPIGHLPSCQHAANQPNS